MQVPQVSRVVEKGQYMRILVLEGKGLQVLLFQSSTYELELNIHLVLWEWHYVSDVNCELDLSPRTTIACGLQQVITLWCKVSIIACGFTAAVDNYLVECSVRNYSPTTPTYCTLEMCGFGVYMGTGGG